MRAAFRAGLAMGIWVLTGCGTDNAVEPPPQAPPALRAVQVASGLASPVHLTAPPGDPRLFVVEQPGRIRIIEGGQLLATPFLDLGTQVVSGGERGLLSLAFAPDHSISGEFYVNYTGAGGATRVERYRTSSEPNRADPASGRLVLSVPQPFANHNGGQIAFGLDGMLYIGMGDGGSGGDPLGHGQNRQTLLGALLRIDPAGGDPYAIPSGNPFSGGVDGRAEIWAIGLRNPWRFSFDRVAGTIYIADVGQNRREEVNARPAAEAGLNYGWNVMEGRECHPPGASCSSAGLVLPVHEYVNPAEGCSVTGGHVYRGNAIPALQGHYVYGDFCRGDVRSFRLTDSGAAADHRSWELGALGSITSFGEDATGELYVLVQQGRVYRLEP